MVLRNFLLVSEGQAVYLEAILFKKNSTKHQVAENNGGISLLAEYINVR